MAPKPVPAAPRQTRSKSVTASTAAAPATTTPAAPMTTTPALPTSTTPAIPEIVTPAVAASSGYPRQDKGKGKALPSGLHFQRNSGNFYTGSSVRGGRPSLTGVRASANTFSPLEDLLDETAADEDIYNDVNDGNLSDNTVEDVPSSSPLSTPKRDAVKELQRKLAKRSGWANASGGASSSSTAVSFSALVAGAKSSLTDESPFLVPVVSAASAAYLPSTTAGNSASLSTAMDVDSATNSTSSTAAASSSTAHASSASATPIGSGPATSSATPSSAPTAAQHGGPPASSIAAPFSGAPTFAAALASTPSAATMLSAESRLQKKQREQKEAIANALARRTALGAAQGTSQPPAASQSALTGDTTSRQAAAAGAAQTPSTTPGTLGAAPTQSSQFGAAPAQAALFGAAPAQPNLFGTAPIHPNPFGTAPIQPAAVGVVAGGVVPAQVAAAGIAPPFPAGAAALPNAGGVHAPPPHLPITGAAQLGQGGAGATWMPEPQSGDPAIYGWHADRVHENMHERQVIKWDNTPDDKVFVHEWDGRRHHEDAPTVDTLRTGITRAVGGAPLVGPAEPSSGSSPSSPFLYLVRNLTPAQCQLLLSRRCWSGFGVSLFPVLYAPPSSPFLGSIYGLLYSATLEHATNYEAQAYLTLVNDNYPAGVDPMNHFISTLRVAEGARGPADRPQLIWNVTADPPSLIPASNRAFVTIFEGLEFDSDMHYVGKVIKPALFCTGCKSLGHEREHCAYRKLPGFQDISSTSRIPASSSFQQSRGGGNAFRRNGRGGGNGDAGGSNGNSGGGRRNNRGNQGGQNKRQRT
ncbi:hypothetical protein C8R47DRAFT_1213633 [Mycena vitilis]|nr:hypothetical protein C8R47DRAFT_1213633 [Mycena vitilis]